MVNQRKQRSLSAGGGGLFGAALAALTGSTPIGVVIVAGLGGALAWKAARRMDGTA